jgi:hypothetical protein
MYAFGLCISRRISAIGFMRILDEVIGGLCFRNAEDTDLGTAARVEGLRRPQTQIARNAP